MFGTANNSSQKQKKETQNTNNIGQKKSTTEPQRKPSYAEMRNIYSNIKNSREEDEKSKNKTKQRNHNKPIK